MAQGRTPSLRSETGSLLHDRLRVTAWALAVLYAVLLLWNVLTRPPFAWIIPAANSVQLGLALSIALLLGTAHRRSLEDLRLIEGLLFGGLILLILLTQFLGNLVYIQHSDMDETVGHDKNAILQCILLMTLYGTLIPNDPMRTARLVSLMALAPLFVLAILLEQPLAEVPDNQGVTTLLLAGSNAIYLALGAFIAIYSAFILQGLRKDLHEARRLGQYELGERIGTGGMGDVYMAEHRLLKRPCALKLIKPDVAANAVALARFEREVQAAATLSHPNTIEIFDYGHTDDGTFYYVMEYLPGMTSHDVVARYGPMPPDRAVYLMRQVCGALAEAHRLGIIHRDLKPANILVAILGGECDVAKVLDFGLAKLTTPGAAALTADLTVSGTPSYMSPEQATGGPDVDARSDLYALGAILYFWLVGHPPFAGENSMEVMIANSRDPVVPPSTHRPEIPTDLEAVVLKCLEKRPENRFPDARTLAGALGDCSCASTWDARRAQQWWTDRAAEQGAPNAAGVGARTGPGPVPTARPN
jgi:serine/threonine-protein kinase